MVTRDAVKPSTHGLSRTCLHRRRVSRANSACRRWLLQRQKLAALILRPGDHPPRLDRRAVRRRQQRVSAGQPLGRRRRVAAASGEGRFLIAPGAGRKQFRWYPVRVRGGVSLHGAAARPRGSFPCMQAGLSAREGMEEVFEEDSAHAEPIDPETFEGKPCWWRFAAAQLAVDGGARTRSRRDHHPAGRLRNYPTRASIHAASERTPSGRDRAGCRAAKRSAMAVMVRLGLTPMLPGMLAPSTTNRPGCPCTSWRVSMTPSCAD